MATVPTVYFIDDSATMREVIKIAFRRENINVLTSHDAVLALEEIEKKRPDIVITDVIMPVKDGYEVCQFIKTHPELSKTPVVLMSGVVNRAVAERAFAVHAYYALGCGVGGLGRKKRHSHPSSGFRASGGRGLLPTPAD